MYSLFATWQSPFLLAAGINLCGFLPERHYFEAAKPQTFISFEVTALC